MTFPHSIASEISSKETLRCPVFRISFFSGFQLNFINKYIFVRTKSQYLLYIHSGFGKASHGRIESVPIYILIRQIQENGSKSPLFLLCRTVFCWHAYCNYYSENKAELPNCFILKRFDSLNRSKIKHQPFANRVFRRPNLKGAKPRPQSAATSKHEVRPK